MTLLWWIAFHSAWNQEAPQPRGTAGKIELDLAKTTAAEVAGLPLLTVAAWDRSLAPPSSECKPSPPVCHRGTTRLQLRSTLKRIFKCLLINWALWCAVSVCSLGVFWWPCRMICTVSELVTHSDLSAVRLVCCSCPTFPTEDVT